ncbi:MAG: electron transfer flavoprotein subunit alpha/FixB family protein, partial [Chloroflexota bacterium]
MGEEVLIVAEHLQGKLADVTFELLGKGLELARGLGGQTSVAVLSDDAAALAGELGAAGTVLAVSHPGLAHFTPESYELALADLLRARRPRLVLVGNTTMGMDLAAGLSARLGWPLVAYARDARLEDGAPVITSQLYGGKLMVESTVEGDVAIVSILAGSFPADAGRSGAAAAVEQVAPALPDAPRVRFKEMVVPEAGGVDITKEQILVSV